MARGIRTMARVTEEQMALFYEIADREGMNISALMRSAVFDREPEKRIVTANDDTAKVKADLNLLKQTIDDFNSILNLNAPPMSPILPSHTADQICGKIQTILDRTEKKRVSVKEEMVKLLEHSYSEHVVSPATDYGKRCCQVAVYVSPGELRMIRELADKESVSISGYLKEMLMRYYGYKMLIVNSDRLDDLHAALSDKLTALRTTLYEMRTVQVPTKQQKAEAVRTSLEIRKLASAVKVSLTKADIKAEAAEILKNARIYDHEPEKEK